MRTFSLPLSVILALAPVPAARALTIPPAHSYKVLSRDGAFDFVMLVPPTALYDRPAGQALRRTYPKSGLYRAGSTQPLWTVGWFCDHTHIASDGRHLVSLARHHGSPDLPGVLAFYADGQLLRAYSRSQLVDTPSLLPEHTWISSETFDDVGMTYTLVTADGNRFVFDLTTGEIALSRRWRRWAGAFAGGMMLVVTAGALALALWLRRRQGPSPLPLLLAHEVPPPLPPGGALLPRPAPLHPAGRAGGRGSGPPPLPLAAKGRVTPRPGHGPRPPRPPGRTGPE